MTALVNSILDQTDTARFVSYDGVDGGTRRSQPCSCPQLEGGSPHAAHGPPLPLGLYNDAAKLIHALCQGDRDTKLALFASPPLRNSDDGSTVRFLPAVRASALYAQQARAPLRSDGSACKPNALLTLLAIYYEIDLMWTVLKLGTAQVGELDAGTYGTTLSGKGPCPTSCTLFDYTISDRGSFVYNTVVGYTMLNPAALVFSDMGACRNALLTFGDSGLKLCMDLY